MLPKGEAMKILTALLGAALMSACATGYDGPTMIVMVNPLTGETAPCRAAIVYGPPPGGITLGKPGAHFSERTLNDCVAGYRRAGFVTAESMREGKRLGWSNEKIAAFGTVMQDYWDSDERKAADEKFFREHNLSE